MSATRDALVLILAAALGVQACSGKLLGEACGRDDDCAADLYCVDARCSKAWEAATATVRRFDNEINLRCAVARALQERSAGGGDVVSVVMAGGCPQWDMAMLRVGPSGIDTGAHDLGLPTGEFQEPGGLEAAIVRLVEDSAQRMIAENRLFAQIVDDVRGHGAGGELDFCAPGTLAGVQKALAEACGNTSPPPGPAPEAAKTGVNH